MLTQAATQLCNGVRRQAARYVFSRDALRYNQAVIIDDGDMWCSIHWCAAPALTPPVSVLTDLRLLDHTSCSVYDCGEQHRPEVS